MRSVPLRLAHVLLAVALLAPRAPLPGAPDRAPASPPRRFACADYSQGKIFVVAPDGSVEWQHPAPHCNDLWVLPSGNLLFSTGHGAREVTRDGATVFSYETPSEVYACQRLPDGRTFIGECNAGRLLELESSGKIAKEIRLLPPGTDGGHLYMRNARRLADGHYLVTHYGAQAVREYDAGGALVREIPAPGGPHSAIRLPDGNTLIAVGDRVKEGAKVFEVDPRGEVVWSIRHDELPGVTLRFMAGLHRLPNGNTLLSNWLGHGQFGKGPHLLEVSRDKRVTWTFSDHQTMKTVSSVQALDLPGDPTRWEILH